MNKTYADTDTPRFCCDGRCSQGRACPANDEMIADRDTPPMSAADHIWFYGVIVVCIIAVGLGIAVGRSW